MLRDDVRAGARVVPAAKFVDEGLRHVFDNRVAAGHVAVEGRVAGRHLAFVAGREDDRVLEFVRKRHQNVAPLAGLEVLLRGAGFAAFEGVGEHFEHGRMGRFEGNAEVAHVQALGKGLSVRAAVIAGVARGHGDADDVLGTYRLDRDGSDDAGIDAAGETDERLAEASLGHVVAGGEDECVPDFFGGIHERRAWGEGRVTRYERPFAPISASEGDGFDPVVAVARTEFDPPPGVVQAALGNVIDIDVADDELLGELRSAAKGLPGRVEYERAAIENEFVLAADHIQVGHSNEVIGCARGQHARAVVDAVLVVGRGVDVHDELGTGERYRIERFAGVPDVLTDSHPENEGAGIEDERALASGEVALFIKNAVVGQALLMVDIHQVAIGEDGGGVPGVAFVPINKSDYGDESGCIGCEGDGCVAGDLAELPAEEQVLGRVSCYGKFRERDDIAASVAPALEVLLDECEVAGDVANRRVDLGQAEADVSHGKQYRGLGTEVRMGGRVGNAANASPSRDGQKAGVWTRRQIRGYTGR